MMVCISLGEKSQILLEIIDLQFWLVVPEKCCSLKALSVRYLFSKKQNRYNSNQCSAPTETSDRISLNYKLKLQQTFLVNFVAITILVTF